MDPEIQKKLRETFHPSLVKRNYAGFDHIQGHSAIDRLIQATGETGWSFFISDTKVFTDNTGKVIHVAMLGSLDIGNQRRSDWGEAHTSGKPDEELFKSAQTDTIKRCARMFGVALELYGDMIDDATGEHVGRPQQAAPPRQQPTQFQPRSDYPSDGGQGTGRKTYPSEKQVSTFAIPIARAAGLDWETQQDDIIFAVHGKRGPLYRNDEWGEVQAWMERHKGYEGQWSYDQEGHLVAGPPVLKNVDGRVALEGREDSMDDVPF